MLMRVENVSWPMGQHLPLGEIPYVFVLNQVRLDKQFCSALIILLIIIRQERGLLKYGRFHHKYAEWRPPDAN